MKAGNNLVVRISNKNSKMGKKEINRTLNEHVKKVDMFISGFKKVQKILNIVHTNNRMKNAKKIAKMPEAKILE